jgi:hypothetical protein
VRLLWPLLLLAACASPPPQLTPEQRAALGATLREEVQKAVARLNLTEEQKEQVRPMIRSNMEARREIVERYRIDSGSPWVGRQARREIEDLNRNTKIQLSVVLTEAQMAEFEKIVKELLEKAIAEIRSYSE